MSKIPLSLKRLVPGAVSLSMLLLIPVLASAQALRPGFPPYSTPPLLNNGSLLTTLNPNVFLPNQLPYLYIAAISEDCRLNRNGVPIPPTRLAAAECAGMAGGGGGGGAAPITPTAMALAALNPSAWAFNPGVNIFPPSAAGNNFSRGGYRPTYDPLAYARARRYVLPPQAPSLEGSFPLDAGFGSAVMPYSPYANSPFFTGLNWPQNSAESLNYAMGSFDGFGDTP